MKSLVVFFFFLISKIAFSQEFKALGMGDFLIHAKMENVLNKTYKDLDIEGSPYFYEEFKEGKIFVINNIVYTKIPLRYNIYNDSFEFKNDSNLFEIGAPERIKMIVMGKDSFVCFPSIVEEEIKFIFYRIVLDGKISLVEKMKVKYQPSEPKKPYQSAKPARFERRMSTYFVYGDNQNPVKIKSKKALFEFFDDQKQKLSAYMKKNKLSVRSEADFKEIVSYYNSLNK